MTINRIECIKKSNIFETDEAQKIINENKVGVTVDLYAGANNIADITNDYDKSFQTKYHMEAIQFLKTLGDNSCDTVICDPPTDASNGKYWKDKLNLPKITYNVNGKEKVIYYTRADYWSVLKKEISRVVKIGGVVIYSGCTSSGVGKKLGFEMKEVNIMCHGGWTPDTYITVEIKSREVKCCSEERNQKSTKIKDHTKYAVIDDMEVKPQYENPRLKVTPPKEIEWVVDEITDIDPRTFGRLIMEMKSKLPIPIVIMHGDEGCDDIICKLCCALDINMKKLYNGGKLVEECFGKKKLVKCKPNSKIEFEILCRKMGD